MIHPTLNHRIERAAATWRWQCVVRSLAMVASAAMLVALAIGGSALLGWANTPTLVYALLALTLASSGLAALVMIVRSLDQRLDRQWLAAAVESHEPPLLGSTQHAARARSATSGHVRGDVPTGNRTASSERRSKIARPQPVFLVHHTHACRRGRPACPPDTLVLFALSANTFTRRQHVINLRRSRRGQATCR